MLTLRITATDEYRLLSRILQMLESQRIRVLAFSGTALEGVVQVTATLACERDKAYRLEALAYRVEGVLEAAVLPRSKESDGVQEAEDGVSS